MANKKKQIIKVIATILAVVLLFVGSFGGYLLYRFNCDKSSDYGFVSNDYNNIYKQQVPTFSQALNAYILVYKCFLRYHLTNTNINDNI